MWSSKLRRAALAFAAVLALSAGAQAESVYHRGNSADPETLDQHKTTTAHEGHILRDLYEGLVAYDAKGDIIPGVAQSWEASQDGLAYTFRLRPDATWSNGDPVTAQDFVFSFRRMQDPQTGAKNAAILHPIKNAKAVNKGAMPVEALGVEAVDDRTLRITLESPTPYLANLLAQPAALPLNPASVERHGTDLAQPGNMVTNGAYMLAHVAPNAPVRLVKNPRFHDAEDVRIDTVIFHPTEDRAEALQRFQAGELHSNDDVPTEQMSFIRRNLGDQLRVAPYLGTYYYAINTDKPPFDDVRMRQALSMAIDRKLLAEEVWGGTMLPATSLVPPGISNYGAPVTADYEGMSLVERQEKAAALLAEAGFGPDNPLKVEVRYNAGENHKNTAVAIADMWKPLGVETSLLNADTAAHYALLRNKGNYDIARAGWIADYSDPQNFLSLLQTDNPDLNYPNYSNPEYDALMERAAKETDLQKRAEILRQAEGIITRDVPFIPLLHHASKNLVSSKLRGWEDNVLDVHPTRWLSLEE